MDDKTKLKIGKMIGLLGSDHDGEVLAAARAIGNILASQKMTFGDLVRLIVGNQLQVSVKNEVVMIAESILENEIMLKENEARFVRDVLARSKAWPKRKLTEKQAAWLNFLYAKYGNH